VLLQKNAKVYLGSRSEEKARKAINELKEITGKEAVFFKLDLANLDSIRKSVEEYKTYAPRL
jgi:retinol dehydrogenase-12